MSYKNYRKIDLSFFLIIGMITVAISEGLFILLPDAQFRLSLVMLVAFIATVRWGARSVIPYFLSLLVGLFFNNNYENMGFLIPYYLVTAVSFVIPIHFLKELQVSAHKSLMKIYLLFIISFLSQAVGITILIGIVDKANVINIFINYLAVNLFNLTLILLFLYVLFRGSNDLFRNMYDYLIEIQGEEKEDEHTQR